MFAMIFAFFLIFFVKFIVSFEQSANKVNFSVVSTSQRPKSDLDDRVQKIEQYLDIDTAVKSLKENIEHFQKVKFDIVDEIKRHLNQIKEEIVADVEIAMKKHLADGLDKNEKVISDLENKLDKAQHTLEAEMNFKIENIKNEIIKQTEKYTSDLQNKLEDNKNTQLGAIQKNENELKQTELAIMQKITNVEVNLQNGLIKIQQDIISETEKRISNLNEKKCAQEIKQDIISEIHKSVNTPSDCKELKKRGNTTSGIYKIRPNLAFEDFPVWCDMKTKGGGWTYVVNRFDGSQNFHLNWTDYKSGFGDIFGEYWLGLEHLYKLTNSKPNELLFELTDWEKKTVYASYSSFKIGNEFNGYSIKTLGNYSGDAGNSFSKHLGSKFSTSDKQQDTTKASETPCAIYFEGGWWFARCHWAYLNGKYIKNPENKYYKSAIKWEDFHGFNYSLKEARMMVRPVD